MDPDDFLDWLESKRDDARSNDDQVAADVMEVLIDDFNSEFDTRDSPPSPTLGGYRKKKEKK